MRVLLNHHANVHLHNHAGETALVVTQARAAQVSQLFLPQSRTVVDKVKTQAHIDHLNTIVHLLKIADAKR